MPHRPLAAEPDRDGPRRMDTGGAGEAGHRGSGARVPGGRGPARGRPGGPLGCGWWGGGVEGPGVLGGEHREALGGWARAPEGGRSLGGGGGVAPCPGNNGGPS